MFKTISKIPNSAELREKIPFPDSLQKIKDKRDGELKDIITGKSGKFLLIIGPCSADNTDSVIDYVARLGKIAKKTKDALFIVPRIYTNKPRSKGDGYKGFFSSPDPSSPPDIAGGIIALRKMHIRAISESGLTAADEMLYPDNYSYVEDLLSYNTVGARSTENQEHRLVSSGIGGPVGFKNPMAGSVQVMLNSIYAAQIPQIFKYHSYEVSTDGNPYAHAVLRGYVDNAGRNIPNYHYEDVVFCIEEYKKSGLKNPSIIIDCSHSNSNKNYREQIRVADEIMNNRKYSGEIKKFVKGLMIESYITEGSQAPGGTVYGQSITDGCLGWEETEKLIYNICEKL